MLHAGVASNAPGCLHLAGKSCGHHLQQCILTLILLQELQAIGRSCPKLQTLNVSRCHNLKPDALQTLLMPQPCWSNSTGMDVQPLELLCHEPFDDCVADDDDHLKQDNGRSVLHGEGSAAGLMLPELRELDISYCHLPTYAICCLLGQASRLTVSLTPLSSPGALSTAYLSMDFASCCLGSRHYGTATFFSIHLPNSWPDSIVSGRGSSSCSLLDPEVMYQHALCTKGILSCCLVSCAPASYSALMLRRICCSSHRLAGSAPRNPHCACCCTAESLSHIGLIISIWIHRCLILC